MVIIRRWSWTIQWQYSRASWPSTPRNKVNSSNNYSSRPTLRSLFHFRMFFFLFNSKVSAPSLTQKLNVNALLRVIRRDLYNQTHYKHYNTEPEYAKKNLELHILFQDVVVAAKIFHKWFYFDKISGGVSSHLDYIVKIKMVFYFVWSVYFYSEPHWNTIDAFQPYLLYLLTKIIYIFWVRIAQYFI